MRYYIKHKGGDPRNHNWVEVTEYTYNNVNKESHFKKELDDAEQRSEKKENEKKKAKRLVKS